MGPMESVWLPERMSRHDFAMLGQRFTDAADDFRTACAGTTDHNLVVATQLLEVVQQQVLAYLRRAAGLADAP